jgi:hypothetical protein
MKTTISRPRKFPGLPQTKRMEKTEHNTTGLFFDKFQLILPG